MTDKIEEIRERWAKVDDRLHHASDYAADDITALLAEVDRLREKIRVIKYNVEDLNMVVDQ